LREEEPGAETSLFKQKQDESKCQEYVSVSWRTILTSLSI
jgi:hypothetical protein